MRIYLIGYMGSGKSSIGKKVATRLGYTFFDLDQVIEKDQNASVSDIFNEKGEKIFRSLERLALHQTFSMNNVVISTGGGTPVFFDNMHLMNSNGLVIFLKADADFLVSRLTHKQNQRPLLASLSPEEMKQFVKEQVAARSPFYQKAAMHIEAKDLTPAALEKQVRLWLENKTIA